MCAVSQGDQWWEVSPEGREGRRDDGERERGERERGKRKEGEREEKSERGRGVKLGVCV